MLESRNTGQDNDGQERVEIAIYDVDDSQLDAVVENQMKLPVDESVKYQGGFNVEMVRSPSAYLAKNYYING